MLRHHLGNGLCADSVWLPKRWLRRHQMKLPGVFQGAILGGAAVVIAMMLSIDASSGALSPWAEQ